MTISELGFWDKSKLVLRLFFKTNSDSSDAMYLLDALKESSLRDVRVIGRGGVEVSVDEIKNSPEFIEMQNYAKFKIIKDKREEMSHGRSVNNTSID